MRPVDPLGLCSVTGSVKRDKKSVLPLELQLRYSSVWSNEVRNSSHPWTRALYFPTLPICSPMPCYRRIRGRLFPKGGIGVVREPRRCCRPRPKGEPNISPSSADMRDKFHGTVRLLLFKDYAIPTNERVAVHVERTCVFGRVPGREDHYRRNR